MNITEYANGYDYKIRSGKGKKAKFYYVITDSLCHLTFDSCYFKFHRKNLGAKFLPESIRETSPEHLLIINGISTDTANARLPYTIVKFWKNGQYVKSIITDSAGKYEQSFLDFGNVYKVEFEHADFVSKHLIVDTRYSEDTPSFEHQTYLEVSFSLYPKLKGINYCIITSKPIAIAKFDETGKLNYDFTYVSKRIKEIQEFFKSLE